MDIQLDTIQNTITYEGNRYDLKNGLNYYGEWQGNGVRPYIRNNTKLEILKKIEWKFPQYYRENKEWLDKYRMSIDPTFAEKINKEKWDNSQARAMEELAEAVDFFSEKVQEMNTNSKLETAIIEGITEKAKELALEDFKENIDKYIVEMYGSLPTKIEIKRKDITYEDTGIYHKQFENVLKLVDLNIPVMLTGGAGSGKNYLVEQVSKALNLSFYYTSSITQEYKLTGFIDGAGKFHETEFFKAFTSGGIFMLDEVDASIPECLVILNGAIANGYFDFPTGREIAHEDFRIITAGNTTGQGADIVYTGRNVLDGATLDRFALVDIDYDNRIEEILCPDEELRSFLYKLRSAVKSNVINHIVGMRSFKNSYILLQNEFDKEFILKSVILKGLGRDDINVLKQTIPDSEWKRGM